MTTKWTTFPILAALAAGAAAESGETKRPFAVSPAPAQPAAALRAGATPLAIDFATLAGVRSGERMAVPVAANQELAATVRRVESRGAGRFSIFGRLADDPDSTFIVAVESGAAAAIIESPRTGEVFLLTHLAEGLGQVALVDRRHALECGLRPDAGPPAVPSPAADAEDAPPAAPGGGEGEGGIAGACPAPPENFDVIIAYTVAAMNEAGGRSAIQAVAQLAVDQANQVYEDSGIRPRMTLVFTKQVPYVESTDIYDDRDALADPNDNQMDALHDDRDEFGADFVCLLVANVNNNNAAGVAFCTPSGPEEGFCVVLQSQAVANISFAHEIGHLQGCAHDRANAGIGCAETCYAHGWRFFGDSGQGWRTVMAYDNNAGDYTRIGRFSNPDVSFDGEPTGNDNQPCIVNENNARLINETALSRESWRTPRFDVWVEQGAQIPFAGTHRFPWPTVANGVAAVYGGTRAAMVQPVLNIKAGVYGETMTINKPMTIRSCGGAATIGR